MLIPVWHRGQSQHEKVLTKGKWVIRFRKPFKDAHGPTIKEPIQVRVPFYSKRIILYDSKESDEYYDLFIEVRENPVILAYVLIGILGVVAVGFTVYSVYKLIDVPWVGPLIVLGTYKILVSK